MEIPCRIHGRYPERLTNEWWLMGISTMYLGIDVVSKFGFGIAIIWFSRWTIGFMVDMLSYLIGSHKSTYNWGAPHCIIVTFVIIKSKTWIYFGKGWQGWYFYYFKYDNCCGHHLLIVFIVSSPWSMFGLSSYSQRFVWVKIWTKLGLWPPKDRGSLHVFPETNAGAFQNGFDGQQWWFCIQCIYIYIRKREREKERTNKQEQFKSNP